MTRLYLKHLALVAIVCIMIRIFRYGICKQTDNRSWYWRVNKNDLTKMMSGKIASVSLVLVFTTERRLQSERLQRFDLTFSNGVFVFYRCK
jgi:hypothetical protein